MEMQNWKQLTSIQVGGAICLPVIMIGQTLADTYGFVSAALSILIGNLLLLGLGLIAANMSHRNKKTTVENARQYLGKKGVSLFALAMLVSMLGWYGIQLNLMTLSMADLLGLKEAPQEYLRMMNIILGCLVTYVGMYGIRALNVLSDFSLPILIVTLVCAVYSVDQEMTKAPLPLSFGGVALVFVAAIAVIIDLPTYFRHATTSKDGLISILLIFGLAMPLIEWIGVYLAMHSNGNNILDILKGGGSPLWSIWIALFLLLAGWTTNNTNLYSGVISLEYLLPRLSPKKRTWLVGGVGTLLSCLNLLDNLELVLDLLGTIVTVMGSIVLVRYCYETFIIKKGDYEKIYNR